MYTTAVPVGWKPILCLLPLLFVCVLSTANSGYHPGAGLIAAFDNPQVHTEKPTLSTPTMTGTRNLTILTMPKVPNTETKFLGEWKVDIQNVGVAAMQLQLMNGGKVVWFDTTGLGPSGIVNSPQFCRKKTDKTQDCHAHAVEYDPTSATFKTIKIINDPWCSSGGLTGTGDLVSIGGSKCKNDVDAQKAVRILAPATTEFRENVAALAENRWYASQVTLEDGTFMVVGGRNSFSYEIVPPSQLNFKHKLFNLPFLKETTTPELENNLYPFLHLLPDGNVFVFANTKSIILDPHSGKVVRRLPDLLGGSRNYPSSGMSALLPMDLSTKNVKAEVMICGGNSHEALKYAERMKPKQFLPALSDCNRIVLTEQNSHWEKEEMPSPRVMGDMLILPNGDLLMINGAKKGCSGWENADEPNLTPVLYMPDKPKGQRMRELAPTKIARMYHAASTVLPNGQVLIAGSNPHEHYDFKAKYPTELRVEKFSPPYLDPTLVKGYIAKAATRSLELQYNQPFEEHVRIKVKTLYPSEIKVTLYAPPFTSHGNTMNQRLISLGLTSVSQDNIKAMSPANPNIAPPGHYLLFVVYRGVPSWSGRWVRLFV